MRIVLVTHFYPAHGGGVEKVAEQLAARMAADGVEVVWCASNTDAPPNIAGVHCKPMRAFNGIERLSGFPYPLWGPRSLMQLRKLVSNADAVHVHDCIYAGSMIAALLARWNKKRLAVTQHIGVVPLPAVLRPVLALANRIGAAIVLKRADGVGFISPAVRSYFESFTGASPRFHYVANGVDGDIFNPVQDGPDSKADRRLAMGLDPHKPLLLFVGRFVAKKRLPIVREIAKLRPDWQWCVIGHGPEQPQTWGLANVRVVPAMAQRELAAFYRIADLLVLPSHGEGFPLVVQEAMACGLPACITAGVAAGAQMPRDLWVELPEAGEDTARSGVGAIDSWLGSLPESRVEVRKACARFAMASWQWKFAVQDHLGWLRKSSS